MIDTHCHLYSEEFSADREEMLERALASGVRKFYMPAIDSRTTTAMLAVEKDHEGICLAMAGLHPCSVNENVREELIHVQDLLDKRPFPAIGEIGLDFYWDKTFIEQQYTAFRRQIELALQYKLPIVIHSRNATAETIAVIKEYTGSGLKGIFHCFGGSVAEAEQITGAGFLLGIGGVITYKNSGLAEVISQIGLMHVVLETDAPYLSPVPYRGKRNESCYLGLIAAKIADATGSSIEDVSTITTSNASRLFSY